MLIFSLVVITLELRGEGFGAFYLASVIILSFLFFLLLVANIRTGIPSLLYLRLLE